MSGGKLRLVIDNVASELNVRLPPKPDTKAPMHVKLAWLKLKWARDEKIERFLAENAGE